MNFIDTWRVNREIRARKREIAVMQEICPHEYTYVGERGFEYFNGYDVDFYDMYVLYCGICDKEHRVSTKRELNVILAKQDARNKKECDVD